MSNELSDFPTSEQANIGFPVVRNCDFMVKQVFDGDRLGDLSTANPHGLTVPEYIAGWELNDPLYEQRVQIRNLDATGAERFADRILGPDGSPFLRGIIEDAMAKMGEEIPGFSSQSTGDKLQQLITVDMEDAWKDPEACVIPDATFLNILQYAADRRDGMTVAEYKRQYEERFRALVERGILPPKALNRLAFLPYTPVGSVEPIEGMLNPDDPSSSGWAGETTDEGACVINTKAISTEEERKVVFHELTHALATNQLSPDGEIEMSPLEESVWIGGGKYNEMIRIFNEGVTELITTALLEEYTKDAGSYTGEQNIITALCDCSDGQLVPQNFVEAYFAEGDDETDMSWLLDKIQTIYPDELIDNINQGKYEPWLSAASIYIEWRRSHPQSLAAGWMQERQTESFQGLVLPNLLADWDDDERRRTASEKEQALLNRIFGDIFRKK